MEYTVQPLGPATWDAFEDYRLNAVTFSGRGMEALRRMPARVFGVLMSLEPAAAALAALAAFNAHDPIDVNVDAMTGTLDAVRLDLADCFVDAAEVADLLGALDRGAVDVARHHRRQLQR